MYKELEQFLPKEIIRFNEPMKNHSTFGIGGNVSALLMPRTIKELIKCKKVCLRQKINHQVIGNGSNILFKSANTKRVIITTKNLERQIKMHKTLITVGAGVLISELCLWCAEKGLSGLENLYGIPATVGGMVMMNASAFGTSVYDCLKTLTVLRNKKIEVLKSDQIEQYHHSTSLLKTDDVVLSVEFEMKRLAPSVIYSCIKETVKLRQEKQPKGKSAGSVFLPTEFGEPAGKIIDNAGLKGLTEGGAIVSEKHANFIINQKNATDEDVKKLIKKIQKIIHEKYNIKLRREIEFIGDRDDYHR